MGDLDMRIAVVDDERIFRERLCMMIDEYYNDLDVLCTQFSDGAELIDAYKRGKVFDAVFLDIEMPKLDGMSAANQLRIYSKDVPIIFLTSHTEFAMDGYEVNAFRFLPKNFKTDKLEKTLDDLSKQFSQVKKIILKCSFREYVISPQNVICAESDNNTVNFSVGKEKYSVRMKLSAALNMLNDALPVFIKVHRCSVINLGHVCGYTDKEVRMDNGEVLPISKSCLADFKKHIFEYVKHNAR